MERPRIRHIAINVQDRDQCAEFYKTHFGLQETYRGPNGTIYLSDGFVNLALIHQDDMPLGINHFGFVVDNVAAIEQATGQRAKTNVYGAVAEAYIMDPEGNRVDASMHGWPIDPRA